MLLLQGSLLAAGSPFVCIGEGETGVRGKRELRAVRRGEERMRSGAGKTRDMEIIKESNRIS